MRAFSLALSEPLFVGASGAAIRLAGEGALKDAFAGKPGSYMSDLPLADWYWYD
ncbi:hypothetical protein ACYZT2_25100 [Pseudomonas sp. MDT1-85]